MIVLLLVVLSQTPAPVSLQDPSVASRKAKVTGTAGGALQVECVGGTCTGGGAGASSMTTDIRDAGHIHIELDLINGKLPAPVSGRMPVDPSGVTSPVSLASVPTHPVTQSGTWTASAAGVASATTPASCTTVGATSTNVLPSQAGRKDWTVIASPANTLNCFFRRGATALVTDLPLVPGQAFTDDGPDVYTGAVDAICAGAAQTVCAGSL